MSKTTAAPLALHPLCKLIPEPDADDYARLRTAIKQDGLRQPITLYAGKILDGRTRYKICRELKVTPRFDTYTGKDPLGFVLAMNIERRHLTPSQLGMVAARVANMRSGRPSKETDGNPSVSLADAAQRVGVSRDSVVEASAVLASGDAELIAKVDQGEMPVHKAAAQVRTAQRATAAVKPAAPGRKGEVITVEQWKRLSPEQRQQALATEGTAKFNPQQTLDIEWARFSVNPVTGCLHNCPYCYARDIAEGNGSRPPIYSTKFQPALWPGTLTAPRNTLVPEDKAKADPSYRNVFICSMADLFGQWVPKEWIERILQEAADNPQWNFLCLTKFPQRLAEFTFPDNWWMGTTVDAQVRVKPAEEAFAKVRCKTKWISCEPLLEPLRFSRLDLFQWIVIGGASAASKTPAWVPPLDWVMDLHAQARAAGLKIYYKTNLLLPDELRVREFPGHDPEPRVLPKEFRYLKGM